jgi:urea transport system substrate-binding protein
MNKSYQRRGFLRVAGATLAGAGAVAGFPAILKSRHSWAQSGAVPVGSLLDRTGPINISGLPAIAGTEFAVEEINAKDGLLGRQLRLIQYDTQSDIAKYPQFARKLILEDEAVVIHGAITSASREAMRPVINEYGQLYFYNNIYEGGVCDKYVFVVGQTPGQQMGPLAKYALKNYGSKCYTIAADYNFGHISWKWWDIFWRNGGDLEAVGGTPRGEHVGQTEFIPLDVTDFNATIQRIQEAQPDVLMTFLVGGAHVNFYRQFAAAGLNKRIPIISTNFGSGNEHIILSPEEVRGTVVCAAYFDTLATPESVAFQAAMKNKMGADWVVGEQGATNYTGWMVWAKAVEKAGSFERVPVTEALEDGIEFVSPLGRVATEPKSHHMILTMHLAALNDEQGWDIMESYEDVPPSDTMQRCDLIANPDTHTQFQPE